MKHGPFEALCFMAFLLGLAKAQSNCDGKKLSVRVVEFESDHCDIWLYCGDFEMTVSIGPSGDCKVDKAKIGGGDSLWRNKLSQCKTSDSKTGDQNRWYDVDLGWESECLDGDNEKSLRVVLWETDLVEHDVEMNQEVAIPRHTDGECETDLSKVSLSNYDEDQKKYSNAPAACTKEIEESGSRVRLVWWWTLPLTCSAGKFLDNTGTKCDKCQLDHYMDKNNHRSRECYEQTTCNPGYKISKSSSTKQQTCSKCEKDTFIDASDPHRIETCTKQGYCGPGKVYSSGSAQSSKRTCTPCPQDSFQTSKKHRLVECTPQPTCGRGEKISQPSSTSKQTCSQCPLDHYMDKNNHRSRECILQTTCNPGYKISKSSSTKQQTCSECENNTFIDASNHRIETCTNQGYCGPGEYSSGSAQDINSERTCTPCPQDSFQTSNDHRLVECTPQPECGMGQKISQPSSTSKQTCSQCPDNTYNNQATHRDQNCTSQPRCEPGFKISAASLTEKQNCNGACDVNTYINVSDHRIPNCTEQPTCPPGFKISAQTPTERQMCIPCGNNTYMDEISHRQDTCKTQPKCTSGVNITGSATKSAECNQVQIAASSSAAAAGTLSATVGGVAGGFAALLLIIAAAFLVISRRNAAQRAETALLGAKAVFNIPAKNGAHKNAPANLARAGAPAAVVNAAFTGVLVLDSSVDSLNNNSSTDDAPQDFPATPAPVQPDSKFVAPVMVLGDGKWAAIGLTTIMGVDVKTYKGLAEEKAIKKMVNEFKKSADAEHQKILDGLIKGTYCNPGSSTPLPSLAEIMSTMELVRLKKYGLQSHHVLAIRLYTTACYEPINAPLRTHDKPHPQLPHPFAATMYYITDGLRKLLVASGDDLTSSSNESILWRGVANVGIADNFKSGTEMACMSTSESPTEALNFANDKGFMFHIVCNDYISKGQDISFISVYPHEKEVLYPPLTYLNIDTGSKDVNRRAQARINKITAARKMKPIKVVTVRPTYPKE